MSSWITDTIPMRIPAGVAADQPARAETGGVIRPVLWLLVIACATGNVITSLSGLVVVSIIFGVLTLSFGATLARHHYRTRRR
jgi:uncharacterized membrane protein YedE/YeeE